MKIFFASDIHGDIDAARAMVTAFAREGANRMVLLGDLLYHGPRNDLPAAYAPKEVIAMLSSMADKILAVRGNCDTEVDQMVLPFPILADYAVLPISKSNVAYLTHGHRFGVDTPPPLLKGDVLIQGHTHIAGVTHTIKGNVCLNPGSVSMPKSDTPACYMIWQKGVFSIRRLADGSEFCKYDSEV